MARTITCARCKKKTMCERVSKRILAPKGGWLCPLCLVPAAIENGRQRFEKIMSVPLNEDYEVASKKVHQKVPTSRAKKETPPRKPVHSYADFENYQLYTGPKKVVKVHHKMPTKIKVKGVKA